MVDLTVILLTANRVPASWAQYHRYALEQAAGDYPIITVSRQPMDWGTKRLLDTEPMTPSNIYFQLLQGAKAAETEFIGVAEDDTLYPHEHYHTFRPKPTQFAYNRNRLGLFTWGRPTYFWKDRWSNSTLIAPRALLIEALEERFTKYPNGTPSKLTGEVGRPMVDKNLGLTVRDSTGFFTEFVSVVRLDHPLGIDALAVSKRKRMGSLKSYDIPHWGRADLLVRKFV